MKTVVRTIIFGLIIAALIVAFYFYLSNRTSSNEEKGQDAARTELETVLSKDISKDYPGTPRAVIKWHNRILQLYYNGKLENSDITRLCDQDMLLWDADLLQLNPREVYLNTLNGSIADYRAHGRKIQSSDVADTDDVRYSKKDGRNLSYVIATYFITEGSGYTRIYQNYCMRQDSAGRWKILAFQLCDSVGNPVSEGNAIDLLQGAMQ